jgi:hypothetical protein
MKAGFGLSLVAIVAVALTSCGTATNTAKEASPFEPQVAKQFTPGVEGREDDEVCQTTTEACQKWTELAKKCEENTKRRNEGFMGKLEPYCTEMETYREQVTGIALSTAPGAFDF